VAQGRTKQLKRTLDWIISKNQTPKFKKEHSQEWWEKLVRIVLADRKKKRALWAKQGESNKPYLPERDFEPEKHGYRLIDVYE
jgi:predicted Holliday junction resolvase-like endonuclease